MDGTASKPHFLPPQLIIARVIHSRAYHDAQDVISAALLALAEDLQERHSEPRPSRLWALREGLRLGDVSVRELIDEGRE